MFDIRLRTKRELKALFTNLKAKGITDEMAAILIDLCYNQPVTMRTSGFYWAGNPDAIMQWDDPSRTLTLTPRPADPELEGSENYIPHFRIYSWAKKPVLHDKGEAESIQLPDQEGLYVVYYETNAETGLQYLTYLKNPTSDEISVIYLVKIVVAVIYWNADWKQAVYFGEERHGSEWIPAMHWWAHGAFNAIRDHGLRITDLTIGDGSQDVHARFGVSAGAAWHEDIYSVVESDILSTEGLPVLYNIAGTPRFTGTDFFPVMNTGTGRIAYNNGPAGYAEARDRKFVFYHVFWTNCLLKPIIAVMGQAAYDQAREAVEAYQAELESLDIWMPHQTKLLISSLLFETSDDFTNSVKGRIVGEMTPEGIADIISEDNIPALKTGWNPDIQEHMAFNYSEVTHQLQVDLLADFTTYFVTGIKYKIGIHIYFPALPDTLGMHYLTGNGQSWSHSVSWDEHATTYVKLAALYRNPRLSQTQYLGWRMHTWEMDGRTRGSIIDKTGLEILSGLSLSINAVNTHEIDVTDGSIRLAEIIANIVHNSGSTFGQFLRRLRARRHWLKTYVDDTDPQAPVVTHEWEYQDTPAANVASLSAGNQVVVNQCIEDVWQLVETADGDYSAMWLIATMDYAYPLKWITGVGADIDLDSAKELNGAQTLLEIIQGARFLTDHFRVIARVMVRNIAADPYYELIEIEDFSDVDLDQLSKDIYVESAEYDNQSQQLILHRTGKLPDIRVPMNLLSEMSIRGDGSVIFPFSLENDEENPGPLYIYSTNQAGVKGWWPLFSSADPESSASGSGPDSSGSGSGSGGDISPGLISDRYVSQILFDPVLRILTLKRTAGLSDLVVEIPGGESGGQDGVDAYVYVAYASDNTGTGFSLTPTSELKYRAEIHVSTPLVPPTIGDFAGATWVKYLGDDGEDGLPGADGQDASDSFDIYVDFQDASTLEFVYTCPYAMKINSQISEGADATLSPPAGTNMAQFGKLTITAAEVGLIILIGELL